VRRSDLLLGLWVLFACAYFYNGASWNQNARLDPIFAFVESGPDQGSFRIDRFLYLTERAPVPLDNTGDWAYHDGHFYSNKAPGTTLIGIPFYLLIYHAEQALGLDVDEPVLQAMNAYLINLWVSGFFVTLAAVAFRHLLERSGTPPGPALAVALLLFFATALFPYSTQLWGHTTAAAMLVLALHAQSQAGRERTQWAGFAAGLAVLTEYTAIIAVAALGVMLLLQHWRRGLDYALGGMLPLALFLYYHWICFGSPFALASSFSNPAFIDANRQFGLLGLPTLAVLYELTFSPYRGIFTQMPILLAGVTGLGLWLWHSPRSGLGWVALTGSLGLLLLIAGFNGWHGGATVVSRYLIVAFPLLLLGLPRLLSLRWAWLPVGVVTAVSCANMFVIAAVSPLSLENESNPLYGLGYELFFSGQLHQFASTIRLHALLPDVDQIDALRGWNLGELLGLEGFATLLPFFVGIALLGFALYRAVQQEGKPS